MRGWSRWGAGLLLLAVIGCGERMLAPPPDEPLPPRPADGGASFSPRLLTSSLVDAAALSADASGIYWTSPGGGLWVLRAGRDLPERLAVDSEAPAHGAWPSRPWLTPTHVFWCTAERTEIHRALKDGSRDDLLVTTTRGRNLVVDADNVYWTEITGQDGGAAVIRALAQDAPPGAQPATLVAVEFNQDISSVAARDGGLYWTPYYSVGATMYIASLWTAAVADLAQGGVGAAIDAPSGPYALTSTDGEFLFAFHPDIWTTSLGRLPRGEAPQTITTLPSHEFPLDLAAADGWLLVSTTGEYYEPTLVHLLAAPMSGGTPKLVTEQLRTSAIATPEGIVFVDDSNRLVALSVADLAKTISPGP